MKTLRSLGKLEGMTADFDEIWPSHADIPIFPDCIRKLREGAERILTGKQPASGR